MPSFIGGVDVGAAFQQQRRRASDYQCGITPLIAAVVRGHTDLAELLLNWGGDLNSGTHEGITTLMAAVSHNPATFGLALFSTSVLTASVCPPESRSQRTVVPVGIGFLDVSYLTK
jgi:hypothetical protein